MRSPLRRLGYLRSSDVAFPHPFADSKITSDLEKRFYLKIGVRFTQKQRRETSDFKRVHVLFEIYETDISVASNPNR